MPSLALPPPIASRLNRPGTSSRGVRSRVFSLVTRLGRLRCRASSQTDAGQDLVPIIWSIGGWAARWLYADPAGQDCDGLSLLWRMHLLGRWFWVAGVVLMALGALLTPALRVGGATPLILLAPLTAVLSLAHAVRTSSGGLRGVEASCPIGFVEVTTGLVLAIVGFDCLLGVMATAGLALLRWAPFVALLAAWLGPLLLLAGISLPIALRWGAIPAAIIGGGPWLMLAAVARLQPDGAYARAFAVPQDGLSLGLHLAAAALGSLLLALLLVRGSAWQAIATAPLERE